MSFLTKVSGILNERFTTAQTLLLGYFIFIVAGSILLMLPVSSAGDDTLSFIDAVFTTISSISGTGLIVVDTATYFSFFGQMVIMVLIQIGNIGYMLFFALAVIFLGGRLSLLNKLIIKESISHSKLDLIAFVRKVFKYTLAIELVAAILLTAYWMPTMPFGEAVKQGVFHSISSFCTAGFSLFSDNLAGYSDSIFVNLVILFTSYLGCIGFFVMYDLSSFAKTKLIKKKRYRLSTHTKIVIVVSISISIISTIIIYLSENVFHATGAATLLESFFQATSASTSVGFNTVDIGNMKNSSLFIVIFEMFIGASPSGTGGGIKTTVFAIMCLALFAFIRDRKHVNTLHRSIYPGTIARAFSISLLALFWIFFSTLVLTLTEETQFMYLLFEAISALGNNGLSTGITSSLSAPAKIIMALSMLIGRVGPLIVGYTLLGKRKSISYQYPEGNILIV